MEIVEKEALAVVSLPVRGWHIWRESPRAWEEFVKRYAEVEHRERGVFVGVQVRAGRQMVGAQVSQFGREVPNGMMAIEFPAQQYVNHVHAGSVAGISEAFGRMYDWATQNGHAVGEFKVDCGYTGKGDELKHDLYLGLLPYKRCIEWHYLIKRDQRRYCLPW